VDADDVQAQLRFVRRALDRGEATRMQASFPEGFFLAHACYGLAWVDQGLDGTVPRRWALDEVRFALSRLASTEGRAPFQESLSPPHGVFYLGWTNWLRAGALLLQGEGSDPAAAAEFERRSSELAKAFDASETPFLVSYPQKVWPVDSVVAIASLRLHDRILAPRFGKTIDRWLAQVKERLDPSTGLIPHRADPRTGKALETARGTSQAMLLRFLAEIDPTWARAQYLLFREKLIVTRLGVPGVHEFPAGVAGAGDVDSGPLLFGVSASATVVARGTAAMFHDAELEDALSDTMEVFGIPFRWGGEKRYAFGLLPVGDAIVAWSYGARRWSEGGEASSSFPRVLSPAWRLPLHAGAVLLIGLVIYLNLLLRRR
jgi:hypothetical protein